jgi:hypothetical protein
MPKPLIEIDTWEMDLNLIKVSALKNNIPVDYELSIVKFEAFIDRHGKRDYCSDPSDYRGEHVQDAGTMSWDEYYESTYLMEDLIEFIIIQEADQVFTDISAGINKIVAMTGNYSKSKAI